MSGVLAAAPALPLHTAGPYVAAAYIVFVALILIYVAIMARKQRRTERELQELRHEVGRRHELEALDPGARGAEHASERPTERIA